MFGIGLGCQYFLAMPFASRTCAYNACRDPNDKSTWHTERTNMPQHGRIPVNEVAPAAWDAICELCGGEDRVSDGGRLWSDGFIVNLGKPEYEGKRWNPKELDNWHVDGDFFSA